MNSDKSLICTKYNIIRQYDNVINSLYFLFPVEYNDIDLSEFSATLFYQLPNGDVYMEVLDKDDELYKEHSKYNFKIASKFTEYGGDVRFKIVLSKDDIEQGIQYLLNTSECKITVEGEPSFYDNPTEGTIESLEQQLAEINAKLDVLPNDISLNTITNELWLVRDKLPVGTPITMEDFGEALVDADTAGLVKVIL